MDATRLVGKRRNILEKDKGLDGIAFGTIGVI
jgi:hypothetical protein